MPDLDFRVESAAPVPFAAAPLMGFRVGVSNTNREEAIVSVALRCQIQIEAPRRRYSPEEQERLLDLFGEPERWGQTLRNLLWANVTATVPGFHGETSVEVQVPCSFDFNTAATKYFHGAANGEIPLCFLFSGSVFYEAGDGMPRVAPISWSRESRFRLPAGTWRELMDGFYPNTAWLTLRRDAFERLYQYKVRHSILTWEEVVDRILASVEETLIQ